MHYTIDRRRVLVAVSGLAAALAAALPGAAAVRTSDAGRYAVADLPPLEASSCWAAALNARGQVVGACKDPTLPAFAVLWQNGKAINLAKGMYDAGVSAINDRGQIVGVVDDRRVGGVRAVMWQSGRIRSLGTIGTRHSSAAAVNERGDVVGATWSDDPPHPADAFVWRGRKMTRIRGPRGSRTDAVAINDRGQVIGRIRRRAGAERGFLWWRSKLTELARRGTAWAPVAINGAGQIIGNSTSATATKHAFLWQEGRLIDLGTLGGKETNASAINERGQIVGWSSTKRGDQHAFLWENGTMRDLGTLGGETSNAGAINEQGQIAGASTTKTGRWRTFLWEKGRFTGLPTLESMAGYAVVDLNERGQVLATGTLKPDPDIYYEISHAVLWTPR